VCVLSFIVWLGAAVISSFLDCVQKSLAGFTDGHAIIGLLYLIPVGMLLYAIGDGLYLAFSFCQAVLR